MAASAGSREPYDCTSDEEEEEEDDEACTSDDQEAYEDQEHHQPKWAKELAAQTARRHTFALVMHEAAGANSPARHLTQELVLIVLSFMPQRRRGSLLLCVGGMGGRHTHFGQDADRQAHQLYEAHAPQVC